MDYEEYREKLQKDGDYDCSCHIDPPCNFCTDTVNKLYEEWCVENGIKPIY